MPLSMPFPDPTGIDELENTYIYAAEVNLNFAKKEGRIVYLVHRDGPSAYANKVPIGQITYNITPVGREAKYGDAPLLEEAVPPTTDEEGNVTDPGSPAVYGEPPMLEPAFPSFDELMMTNLEAYTQLATAVYMLALGQPEFSGASVIE